MGENQRTCLAAPRTKILRAAQRRFCENKGVFLLELRLHWGLGWKLDWRFGWILNRRSVSRPDWARVKTGDWFGERGLGICMKTGQERDMESGLEIGDWIGGCGGMDIKRELETSSKSIH